MHRAGGSRHSSSSATGPQPAYAGIGSRRTPPEVLGLIEAQARRLAGEGWTLRTGLSPGADQAFYRGALSGGGSVELYLPDPGFESGARIDREPGSVRVLSRPSPRATELAAGFHHDWDSLELPARRLLARDAHEVLGDDLESPVQILVCWTADASRDGRELYDDGTGQALRIAHHHGIPVLNLARPEEIRALADL
jgi:hypothetical protein